MKLNKLFGPLFLVAGVLLLAACEMDTSSGLTAEELPPAALAALPPGVPPSVIFRASDGCYAIALEVTEPLQGYRLRDRAGNFICDGDGVTENGNS